MYSNNNNWKQSTNSTTHGDIKLSKLLSWLLRHGAINEKLPINSDGYIDVNELLKYPKLNDYTIKDIKRIVNNDEKKRYSLISFNTETTITAPSNSSSTAAVSSSNSSILENTIADNYIVYKIRANQGHSMFDINLNLQEIKNITEYPIIVHGTYYRSWPKIKSEGLKCMTRQHIHFTANDQFDKNLSGFRSNTQLLIYINGKRAMNNGIQFYLSDNNVILTSGINGTLSIEYFEKVLDRKTGYKIF